MIKDGKSYHIMTNLVFLNEDIGRVNSVWGHSAVCGPTALCYIDKVLDPVVMPFVQQYPGMILQHASARPHITRATQQHLLNNNVKVINQWPALSADLNAIEHL